MNTEYRHGDCNDITDAAVKKAPVYNPSVTDMIMAWLSVVIGYLFIRVMPVGKKPFGAFLFLIALWGMTYIWFFVSGVRPCLRSNIFAVAAIAAIPAFIVSSDTAANVCLYLGELATYMYFVSTAGGNSVEKRIGGMFYADLAGAVFAAPFCNITAQPRSLFKMREGKNGKKIVMTFVWIFVGLLFAVIPTFIVIFTLSFDKSFMDIIDNIFSIDLSRISSRAIALILGIPVAMYGYGAFISSRRKSLHEKFNSDTIESAADKTRFLPSAFVYAALTPILVVYVIFFISQWDMYMSAFTGVLPENMIYSDYAREGFFQLCYISVFNALVLAAVYVFVRRKNKLSQILMRTYMTVSSVMTLILIATAFSKLALYIREYGLTFRRVHAAWFMILLSVAFVLITVKQIWHRFRFTPVLLVCFAVLYGALAYSDVGHMVANYNTNAYLDGRLSFVDVEEINSVGYSGTDSLVRLSEQAQDGYVREEAEKYLKETSLRLNEEKNGVWGFSIPHARAKRILKEKGY